MVKILLLLLMTTSNAWAILYPDINIEQLIDQSDIVFSGTVTSQVSGETNGKPYIQTTFEVIKWYGTGLQNQVTIRQFAKVNAIGERQVFPGLPVFHKNQQYMVFLRNPTQDGFSTPVGLLTFQLFAKSTQEIVQASSQVRAVPNRPVKGLFKNLENQSVQSLVNHRGVAPLSSKDQPFRLNILDQIIQEER